MKLNPTSIRCQVMDLLYSPLLCNTAITKKLSSAWETEQFPGCAVKPGDRQVWLTNVKELEKNPISIKHSGPRGGDAGKC